MFEPDQEAGGYTVICPALPGLVTEGDTLEQARERAAGAIRCYLESLRTDGRRLPLGEVHTKGCRYLFPVSPTAHDGARGSSGTADRAHGAKSSGAAKCVPEGCAR